MGVDIRRTEPAVPAKDGEMFERGGVDRVSSNLAMAGALLELRDSRGAQVNKTLGRLSSAIRADGAETLFEAPGYQTAHPEEDAWTEKETISPEHQLCVEIGQTIRSITEDIDPSAAVDEVMVKLDALAQKVTPEEFAEYIVETRMMLKGRGLDLDPTRFN